LDEESREDFFRVSRNTDKKKKLKRAEMLEAAKRAQILAHALAPAVMGGGYGLVQ
jgi:hypothetical protein